MGCDTFDAGRGSFLTRDGHATGRPVDGRATLRAYGVGCVERIRNPIRAAQGAGREPARYFVGEGAEPSPKSSIALCDSELVIEGGERLKKRRRKRPREGRTNFCGFDPSHDGRAPALDAQGPAAGPGPGHAEQDAGGWGPSLIGCGAT
jgi:beta-aspartyl-peptidase (threonine type)